MPAAHQRSTISPSRQRFTLELWWQMSIIDSIALVERTVARRIGGKPSPPIARRRQSSVKVHSSHGRRSIRWW